MKLRIEKEFKDKNTGAKYSTGEILDFKDARAKELLAHPQGLVSFVEEDTPEAPEESEVEKPKNKKKK